MNAMKTLKKANDIIVENGFIPKETKYGSYTSIGRIDIGCHTPVDNDTSDMYEQKTKMDNNDQFSSSVSLSHFKICLVCASLYFTAILYIVKYTCLVRAISIWMYI
jgi:hypothetical protein